jgi:hypothetical protein
MDTLHRQSGTTREVKKFGVQHPQNRRPQPLPEYGLRIDRDGTQRGTMKKMA